MEAYVQKRQSSKQNISRLVISLVSKFHLKNNLALYQRKTASNASMRTLMEDHHSLNTINAHFLARDWFKYRKFVDILMEVLQDLKEPADNLRYLKSRACVVKLVLLTGI